MRKTTSEDHLGETVTVCHKKVKITDLQNTSYTATGELGGVHQDIVLSDRFVHNQLEG